MLLSVFKKNNKKLVGAKEGGEDRFNHVCRMLKISDESSHQTEAQRKIPTADVTYVPPTKTGHANYILGDFPSSGGHWRTGMQ